MPTVFFFSLLIMKTILITGGTGLVGSALTKELVLKQYKVVVLTRQPRDEKDGVLYSAWDPESGQIESTAISEADVIIHLAGANVGEGRWTKKRKKEIIGSRVKSGELIVRSLETIPNKVSAVISASAIGYYGDDALKKHNGPFVETDPPSNDFLGQVVQQWEKAIVPSASPDRRLVLVRMGVVFSRDGGAYHSFRKAIIAGITPVLGNGRQIMSWLHIDDAVRLFVDAIENKDYNGVYNAVAPQTASNREIMTSISKQIYRRSFPFPVPAFLLKLAVGEMSVEVLKSADVSPEKLVQTGFQFFYPDLESAIRQLEAS